MLGWKVGCIRLVQFSGYPRQHLLASLINYKRDIPHVFPRGPYAAANFLASLHALNCPLILIPLEDFAEIVKVLRGLDRVDMLPGPLLVLDVNQSVQLLDRDGLVPENSLEDVQVLDLELPLHLLLAHGLRLFLRLMKQGPTPLQGLAGLGISDHRVFLNVAPSLLVILHPEVEVIRFNGQENALLRVAPAAIRIVSHV